MVAFQSVEESSVKPKTVLIGVNRINNHIIIAVPVAKSIDFFLRILEVNTEVSL